MDLNKWKSKLAEFGEKALDASGKAFETAGKLSGQALEKTSDFTSETIKTSKYCIQNGEDFDAVCQERNLVVFVLPDSESPKSKVIIGRFPILLARAWQYSATVRILFESNLPLVARAIGVPATSVGIFREGTRKHLLQGEALDVFLDTFDIFFDWNTYTPRSTQGVSNSGNSEQNNPAKENLSNNTSTAPASENHLN